MKHLRSLIAYLKVKPHYVRRNIALGTSGMLTLIIFTMWWSAFSISDSSKATIAGAETPTSVLKRMVSDLREGVNEKSAEIKEELETTAAVIESDVGSEGEEAGREDARIEFSGSTAPPEPEKEKETLLAPTAPVDDVVISPTEEPSIEYSGSTSTGALRPANNKLHHQ